MSHAYGFSWRAFIGFQASWFALIYWQYLALLPVALYAAYAIWRLPTKGKLAVIAVFVLGLVVDSLLVASNIIQFVGSNGLPLWFVLIWLVFAIAAVEFMAAMLKPIWLAVLLAGVGGPLSYFSGAKLSQHLLLFPQHDISWLVLIIVWSVIGILLGQTRSLYVPVN